MNNALILFPYKEPYESLYNDVLSPVLQECDFVPIRVDENPGSHSITNKVIGLIKNCRLIVVEATSMNPNVYFELGLAVGLEKEMILLAEKGTSLPADTGSYHHLLYSRRALPAFRTEFLRWVNNTNIAKSNATRKANGKLSRGDVFDDIVDATFLLPNQPVDHLAAIRRHIKDGSLLPNQYFYSSDRAALRWLDLCNDPRYDAFHQSARYIEEFKNEILEVCGQEFLKLEPDYISLGPGNGEKDKSLLSALVKHSKTHDAFYYPLDISLSLLARAIQVVASEPNLRSSLRIKAIHAEFKDLAMCLPVFDFREEPNLFVFLGNTLGNMAHETDFLLQLSSAMRDEDVAILEVRLVAGHPENPGALRNCARCSTLPHWRRWE